MAPVVNAQRQRQACGLPVRAVTIGATRDGSKGSFCGGAKLRIPVDNWTGAEYNPQPLRRQERLPDVGCVVAIGAVRSTHTKSP